MQTIILTIGANIARSDYDRLITALKGIGATNPKLQFDTVKIQDIQTDDNRDIWICHMAIADPQETINAVTACQEVEAVTKAWAASVGLYPRIAFSVSRSIVIRG